MSGFVNLIKLSVGSESVETLAQWQHMRAQSYPDKKPRHITRMWPKREAEILKGGSIYWVIKGFIQARQRIIGFEERIGDDGIRRCGFVLDPHLVRTQTAQKRPFQGWRYLDPINSPADLSAATSESETPLPPELSAALAEIGVT